MVKNLVTLLSLEKMKGVMAMPRRGENIFKRKDGRWEARYIKEIAIDGSKKYGSVYAKTYKEVKAKQLLYLNKPFGNARKTFPTVDVIMQEWLEQSRNQLKISSYQKYQATVQKHISKNLGKICISSLSPSIISQFTDNLLSNAWLSRETVNNVLIVLGMGLEYAKTHYQVIVPDIHLLKPSITKTRVLSVSEQKILVQYLLLQDNIFSFGMLLALYTGLRIGELCALKWEDFSENTIHISKTMQRLKNNSGQTEVMILPPKTNSSDRVIPIPTALLPIIEKYRRKNGYVLTRPNGKYAEPRLMQNKFAKCIEACQLEGVHFHTLRHTFATRCIESGMDVKTLSEILGHCDVKTTLNKYVHPSLELKQQSIDKLLLAI